MPDVWENIKSPIKNYNSTNYNWNETTWGWEGMLSVCHNPEPIWTPQTHALRIRKEDFERLKYDTVSKAGKDEYLKENDPFSKLLDNYIRDAHEVISYDDFTMAISSAHSDIHNNLKCTTTYATTTAYGLRYVI